MIAPLNWHKWLVLSLLGLALSVPSIGCDYSSNTEKFGTEAVARCNEKCPFQNRTGEGHFDVTCGSECSVHQCKLGCSLWKEGLKNSCQNICNVTSETAYSRELYCVMGCNEALNTYFQQLRELIGTPSAPALVADSLTATSLSLTWDGPILGNNSYLVQWRYEELPGTWQYYSNTSHSNRSIIQVENLRPYTKYRFRVAIFLSSKSGTGEPVYSEPSVVISTLESGRPSSAPAALRAAAPDSSRVAISWEPGPFPNGPLISYVLRLTDRQPNTIDALEDMPASNNTLFYMFQNLAPAREYQVSVAMRNSVGEGPKAYVTISTPPLPIPISSQRPILIVGGEHNILAAPAYDMLSDPIELYSTEHIITGIGLDMSSDSLFIADSNGFVYKSSLSKTNVSEPILTPKTNFKPLDLSVDWLNRHLYVLGEVYYPRDGTSSWEIMRYDFDGKNELVAKAGFFSRPIHFEVDAYNGYLFWALRGVDRGGLYRIDLATISNGVRHDSPIETILRDAHLGAFTVDHADFRILVTHLRKNTVLAVSLDGDSYFHNEYPLAYNTRQITTKQVLVALRSCQPIPVPVNPPLGVQSVMGINRAKVSWSPPHLLGHQGSGAWQHWSFHLQLIHAVTGDTIDIKNISESIYIVEDLKQDAEYTIKVAAVTVSGSGPWSSEFIGRTFASSPTTLHSTLLWSGPDGLLQTDLTGDNLQTLIHRGHLENIHITDISWYRDKLYLVTNASTVMWFNTTSTAKGFLPNMDNVGSLAVDWVGKKIYWSNPKQQLITRGNFDGSNREPVPIVTVAKELTIDSLGAYIYWNTGHAVEAARLNGENKIIYYPAQLFSGKQVMGLTTDLDKKWLYWLVRSYDGSELHRAQTADQISYGVNEVSSSLVTRLPGTATLGPLCYFSGRLVWIQDASLAVVSDLGGKYTAELVRRVHVIAVRDPTLQADSESLIAIPETINSSTIAVLGVWDRFNITWAPAVRVNVNNSRVYYDVSLHFIGQHKIEKTVEVAWIEVELHSVAPYSEMEVTVRAHTHWGRGAAARALLATPQAVPAAPRSARLYVQPTQSGNSLSAIFRWEAPSRANGVILGYEVQCWVEGAGAKNGRVNPSACADAHLPPTHTQRMLRDLMPSSKYFFKVRASTAAGYGQYSEVVSTLSDEVNPVPKVVMSSQEAIKVVDLDSGESETIPKSTGKPVDFAVSVEENIVYWVNDLEEIFSSRINGSGHYKLTSINGSATSICMDWVGRSVYWTQRELTSPESYVAYRADLVTPNTRPQIRRVFSRKQPLSSLQIVPLHGLLFWYEESNHRGLGTLMTSYVNGSNIRSFFNHSNFDDQYVDPRDCNCPENPQIAEPFIIDMTKGNNYEIYWVDPWIHHMIAANMDGCKCRMVVDATEKKKYGFTPMSITVDSKYIYWFNSTEREIFYTNKYKKAKVDHFKSTYGYKIMALDSGNQRYPDRKCLIPSTIYEPQALANNANSIVLGMPPINKPSECEMLNYEMPTTEFTVYYRVHGSSDTELCDKGTCSYVTTTSKELTLNDLEPFTNYTVMLEVTNYYAKLHEIKPKVGSVMVLQTAAEAPKAPKNVSGKVLSPLLAQVQWASEPGLWYEVHWRTDDSLSAPPKYKEYNTFEVTEGGNANLTKLSAGTAYTVWVRARSKHSTVYADSPPLRLRTYPTPAPLLLRNATPSQLYVFWPTPTSYLLHQSNVEYSEASTPNAKWESCSRHGVDEWVATSLRPRVRYRFRLKIRYIPTAPPYFWPHEDQFVFETLGDVPGPPGPVRVESVGERVVRAWWQEPDPRGGTISAYRVWGRPPHRINLSVDNGTKNISEMLLSDLMSDIDDDMKIRIVKEGLKLLHNGTDSYWLIGSDEVPGGSLVQVQARNEYGWGALSAPRPLDALALGPARPPTAALVLVLIALLALLLVVTAGVFYAYNSRAKKKAENNNMMSPNGNRIPPIFELEPLPGFPVDHMNNPIYDHNFPSDADLEKIPHFRREQITLIKFLGSGAFGKVYEGVARQVNGATTDTKVAVKTLRKGATEQEKMEFRREAALMSNFKHEHILRLLGVCRDDDPHYIIMELMEGGDLLSYLRAKRSLLVILTGHAGATPDLANPTHRSRISPQGSALVAAYGPQADFPWLKKNRNCLVAERVNGRVVKIADFGLARDIYKNDYYRKEGEGLLPVRWMAVECLVDGVFTCHSDVWAWGVLCWEILSLGQQPYPARTNREVLSYVRNGGSPGRPPNCPSQLYDLLQQCWQFIPKRRPSFLRCLEVVTALRDKTSLNIKLTDRMSSPPQYITILADDEDSPENEMEPSRLLPERVPKYLELMTMYESDSGASTVYNGYEIPRTGHSRHSIVGVAPNRLIRRPVVRTHSLRTPPRPSIATIHPLRKGLSKRASLCDCENDPLEPEPETSRNIKVEVNIPFDIDFNFDQHQTPF
ncbi:hypothetical protein K1T71_001237 [Dendrolimus kikuchii]|uniref:Uncharacterized protein n=1 Tax=Dendrolimus kikuchii TaxID=765133 RepID=A0ACC1DHE4_9NEOP|nr:hypothetical protein K1T71_001237 [Dendrolimus kikuchii]